MRKQFITILPYIILTLLLFTPNVINAQSNNLFSGGGEQEKTTSRISSGESIPVLIKLANFGNSNRVDVIVNYSIHDSEGAVIVRETETVAVETTAQFVRSISLPHNLDEGIYSARSEIFYPDQLTPAISSFNFVVEKKYFGIFKSTFITYMYIIGLIILLTAFITFLITRNKKKVMILHDYSEVDEDDRLYYEIISDAITQMRLNVGIKAIDLAQSIQGLTLNAKNGKVISIDRDPSVIISELITLFEQKYGSRVNISMKAGRNESRIIIK